MSKTRTNSPNHTATKQVPRMVHESKTYRQQTFINPLTKLEQTFTIENPGVTLRLGSNELKRTLRRRVVGSKLARLSTK